MANLLLWAAKTNKHKKKKNRDIITNKDESKQYLKNSNNRESATLFREELTLYALIGMSTIIWIRSPNARLAMSILGPLLMLLFPCMIFNRAPFPTTPTINTSRETTVLTYLKVSLIPADSEHIGGCVVFTPAPCGGWIELLDLWFSSIKVPGEAVSESLVTENRSECWSLASALMRIFPKQRVRATVHIVEGILKGPRNNFACTALEMRVKTITAVAQL